MTAVDLSTNDGVLDLGRRVVGLIAEGRTGVEIAEETGATTAELMFVVGMYVGLVIVGETPPYAT